MTPDQRVRLFDALLGEGRAVVMGDAGENERTLAWAKLVDDARAQYRAEVEAEQFRIPGAAVAGPDDCYLGPIEAGMVFEYKEDPTQRFVPSGRRGKKGELLDAEGSGLSEPNLRGLYRPVAAPHAEVPCKPWCGTDNPELLPTSGPSVRVVVSKSEPYRFYDARVCRDAGKPLSPAPELQPVPAGAGLNGRWVRDPATGALDVQESAGCDRPTEVPSGFVLGERWRVATGHYRCTHCTPPRCSAYELDAGGSIPFDGACASCAVKAGALVRIEPTAAPEGQQGEAKAADCPDCPHELERHLWNGCTGTYGEHCKCKTPAAREWWKDTQPAAPAKVSERVRALRMPLTIGEARDAAGIADQVAALEAELAEAKADAMKAFAERNAARAEVEQLRGQLVSVKRDRDEWCGVAAVYALRMRAAAAKVAREAWKTKAITDEGKRVASIILEDIERLPLSRGEAQPDAIKAAVMRAIEIAESSYDLDKAGFNARDHLVRRMRRICFGHSGTKDDPIPEGAPYLAPGSVGGGK